MHPCPYLCPYAYVYPSRRGHTRTTDQARPATQYWAAPARMTQKQDHHPHPARISLS